MSELAEHAKHKILATKGCTGKSAAILVEAAALLDICFTEMFAPIFFIFRMSLVPTEETPRYLV